MHLVYIPLPDFYSAYPDAKLWAHVVIMFYDAQEDLQLNLGLLEERMARSVVRVLQYLLLTVVVLLGTESTINAS